MTLDAPDAPWPSEAAQDELERYLDEASIRDPDALNWRQLGELWRRVEPCIAAGVEQYAFNYLYTPGAGDAREVRMNVAVAGEKGAPLVLCLGGIANSARRFDLLARRLAARGYRVASLDWAGRAGSGWLFELEDYGFESCVLQARAFLEHFGGSAFAVIGSSMGGSVAMRLAAETPECIGRLVLNDVGPVIPVARRLRRSKVIGRHYVFREPADLFRRVGAAQKHDGPVEDAVLLHNAMHITRWSDEEQGRVYRHDPRALLAYREEARSDLDCNAAWARLRCPVLVMHGMLSDNLTDDIWRPMLKRPKVAVRHVPETGHTPVLSDPVTTGEIAAWLEAAPESVPPEDTLAERPRRPRRLFRSGD